MLEAFNSFLQWSYEHIAHAIDGRYITHTISTYSLTTIAVVLLCVGLFNSYLMSEAKFFKNQKEKKD